jgi:hypothetical protein
MYGTRMGFLPGDTVNDVTVWVHQKGVGTPPSAIYLGVMSTVGSQLAINANVASSFTSSNYV